MGWPGYKLPTDGWYLYSRGGTEGVFIQKLSDGGLLPVLSEEIEIPSRILKGLVAEEICSRKIRQLEQAEVDEILGMV
ncbi:MAG: hypothetical protein V1897_00020 [Pseudomonadota bacterium]